MKVLSRFFTRFRAIAAIAAAAIALSVSFGMVGAQAGAASGTITWTGNGTNSGLCASSESLPVTVPDGEQAWLFILTSPGTGPFTISTTFSPGGDTSGTGTQEGHGAVHFIVFSPLGATLQSAAAMTGTDHSVLTVSGCQDGAPVSPTTTTTTTTDTPDTTTTTTDTPDTTTTTTTDQSNPTTTTTTDPSNPTTTTTTGPSDTTTTTTDGASTGGNSTGGDSTGGNSTPPSNVVFTPNGGTIVSTAAPTTPLSHSGLAFTGANTAAMVAAAIILIGLGSLLVLVSRRRRRVA